MLFEKSVANVFDELTRYFKGNTNHTEGWKTNDSYKVNQKLVFPWGCIYEKAPWNSFRLRYDRQLDIYQSFPRFPLSFKRTPHRPTRFVSYMDLRLVE